MRSVVVICAGLLAAGCATPESRQAATPWAAGELAASMEVGIASHEVRLSFHVTNTSGAPLRFTFPTSQRYDFVVRDASGAEVWRWSDGRAFAQMVTEVDLAPGESWDVTAAWDPGDRSGLHVAEGRLLAREGAVRQQASFDLP